MYKELRGLGLVQDIHPARSDRAWLWGEMGVCRQGLVPAWHLAGALRGGCHHFCGEVSTAQGSGWALFFPDNREAPILSICASSCPVTLRTGERKHSTSLGPLHLCVCVWWGGGWFPHTSSWPVPQLFPVCSVLAPIAHPADTYCPEKEFCLLLSPGHQCQVIWYQETCTSVWSIGLLTAELESTASKAPTGLVPTTAHSGGEATSCGLVPQEALLNPLGHLCLPGCWGSADTTSLFPFR